MSPTILLLLIGVLMACSEKPAENLGENFDIREFHNKVLETGCVPLKLLEDKIDRWINTESN